MRDGGGRFEDKATRFRRSILWLALLASGCAAGPAFHHTVNLPATKVHIFGPSHPTGWATRGEIMVSGEMIDGKIVPDRDVLGHEVQHLLNIENSKIQNPDTQR